MLRIKGCVKCDTFEGAVATLLRESPHETTVGKVAANVYQFLSLQNKSTQF